MGWSKSNMGVAGRALARQHLGLLVAGIHFGDARLHQALYQAVERESAWGSFRNAEHGGRLRSEFHLVFDVAGSDLLGGVGVENLVAQADDPDTGRFGGLDRAADDVRDRAALAADEDAGQLTDGAAVEALLGLGHGFRLEDVELDHPLRRLELAALEDFGGFLGIAHAVSELDFLEQRSQVGAFQHPEVGAGQFQFGEIGDVVRTELLREGGVVALDVARQHDQRRPRETGVDVFDRLVERLVGHPVGFGRCAAGRLRAAAVRRLTFGGLVAEKRRGRRGWGRS
jgi:hypothetical protein